MTGAPDATTFPRPGRPGHWHCPTCSYHTWRVAVVDCPDCGSELYCPSLEARV